MTEFRRQCKVILALAAIRQCFSLELELGDIEVLKKPAVRLNLSPCDAYGYSIFEMPKLARSWDEFEGMFASQGLSTKGCIA